MQSKRGKRTGAFGRWLTQHLEKIPQYRVYYAHGDKQSESNVVRIQGFFGDSVANYNRLADVDVMVAGPNEDAVVLIEIEESENLPKKIFGDVFAICACNRFAVKQDDEQHYFKINLETKLIIAGAAPAKGQKLKQINEVIPPRLQQFTSPDDSINLQNVSLIFEGDISSTIGALKKKMKELFHL